MIILEQISLENIEFDLIVYFHNDEMNQMGRPMIFIKYYDIETIQVDWDVLEKDWEVVNTNLKWNNVKSRIERINGFKYSLERSTPMGIEKPHLYYLQLVGRRDELSQLDLATMQKSNGEPKVKPFFRYVATYDFMIEGLRPMIN